MYTHTRALYHNYVHALCYICISGRLQLERVAEEQRPTHAIYMYYTWHMLFVYACSSSEWPKSSGSSTLPSSMCTEKGRKKASAMSAGEADGSSSTCHHTWLTDSNGQ